MSNSQLEVQEIDGLQVVEHCKNDASSDLKSKLLHHLVEVSRVVEKKELLKTNNELVNELLLSSEIEPTASESANALKNEQVVWNEQLVQKLIDAKVEPSFSDKLVNFALSLSRNEETTTFEIDTKDWPASYVLTQRNICLRGLCFDIYLYHGKSYPAMYMSISCRGLPLDKSCKTHTRVAFKNHSGQPDWIRNFSKVYNGKAITNLAINSLIKKEEYDEESFGLLKDGKLTIEVTIQADELLEIKQEKPATTTAATTTATTATTTATTAATTAATTTESK